jgi:hypothetical protein
MWAGLNLFFGVTNIGIYVVLNGSWFNLAVGLLCLFAFALEAFVKIDEE